MFAGLDIGTSSVKAVLIDDNGAPVASGSAPLSVSRPERGWSEQDPASWIAACESALKTLSDSAPEAYAAMGGIGLSGQMHGATMLGTDGEPLAPAILWNDGRSAAEARELDSDPKFRELTGNIVFPGFTAPKLAWMRSHRPDVFSAIHKVLLPKDFIRFWLTGETISEMSDASGTAWLDVKRREWSDGLLSATGLGREHMPTLVEGTEQAGALRPGIAERLGLPAGIPLGGGAGDNAASACGVGAVEPGTGFVSIGTSGVLFVSGDRFLPNPESAVHAFCHALPGRWHQMGVTLAAAASLDWLAGIVGSPAGLLVDRLGEGPLSPSSVRFLPYLAGERTPHNDMSVRGAFVGLDQTSDQDDLTQAVLEGVAFSLKDCLDALSATGATINRLTAVGGGARSRYWLKLLATVLELPVRVPVDGDFGAAFGAARLGMIAATGADPEAVCKEPITAETIEPDADLVPAFRDAQAAWKSLYPALREKG